MQTNTKIKAWLRLILFLSIVPALIACGPGEIQPLTFQEPAWGDGEFTEFAVTDVNGNYAGTLRFDIVRVELDDSGDTRWQIRREIAAQGTLEVIEVEVRGNGFRPNNAEQTRSDHLGQEMVRTLYSGTRADLELTTRQEVTTFERVNIPSDVRDDTTLLMIVRALPLAQGYATRLNVFTPILGNTQRMTVYVNGRETVETPAGTFDAWRVILEGRVREQRIQAWIGVDAPHPVVKFIDGRNRGTFEMSDYQAGTP